MPRPRRGRAEAEITVNSAETLTVNIGSDQWHLAFPEGWTQLGLDALIDRYTPTQPEPEPEPEPRAFTHMDIVTCDRGSLQHPWTHMCSSPVLVPDGDPDTPRVLQDVRSRARSRVSVDIYRDQRDRDRLDNRMISWGNYYLLQPEVGDFFRLTTNEHELRIANNTHSSWAGATVQITNCWAQESLEWGHPTGYGYPDTAYAPEFTCVVREAPNNVYNGMSTTLTLPMTVLSHRVSSYTVNMMSTARPAYLRYDRPEDLTESHVCGRDCEEWGCPFADSPSTDSGIYEYNYKPKLQFFGDGPIYLGTELEIQTCNDSYATDDHTDEMAELVYQKLGSKVFLKHDGSIHGEGFEIVTHPMTYDYILENFDFSLFSELWKAGARPHRSCGMHVHVSREAFKTSAHSFKWLKFLYRNRSAVETLARRSSDEWATFDNHQDRKDHKHYAKGAWGGGARYSAVNATNVNTFEVRVFASTLNKNKFLAALGLVSASVEYTRDLTVPDIMKNKGWEFSRFHEWLCDPAQTKYAPLRSELARLGVH